MNIVAQYNDREFILSYCFRFTDGNRSILDGHDMGRLGGNHTIITEIV